MPKVNKPIEELYGIEQFNKYLKIAEKTKYENNIVLQTITKPELLAVIGCLLYEADSRDRLIDELEDKLDFDNSTNINDLKLENERLQVEVDALKQTIINHQDKVDEGAVGSLDGNKPVDGNLNHVTSARKDQFPTYQQDHDDKVIVRNDGNMGGYEYSSWN